MIYHLIISSNFLIIKERMKTTAQPRISPHGNGFVLLSLLLLFLSPNMKVFVSGQPAGPDNSNNNFNQAYARFSPSMAIIIVILIAALFFMGFFSIYIRHCSDSSSTAGSVRRALSMRARRAAAARGLDASVLETFPTFTYSEVKDHKIGKGALECAVCLNEFQDDETLRLIPKCDHVFHPECIDAWLESHVTCPVCRANLAPETGDGPVEVPVSTNAGGGDNNINDDGSVRRNGSTNQDVVIQVEEDRPQEPYQSFETPNRPPRSWSIRRPRMLESFAKFRSHSTGHESLVQPGEDVDRFTLRLPAGVRKEMMDRASLNRNRSFAVTLPREGSSRRGYRDGSSRGGRSYRRIERDQTAKSDRWVFFTRVLSMKPRVVAETGEGSTSKENSNKPPVKLPSFKCLEPKAANETGLVADDSARNPV